MMNESERGESERVVLKMVLELMQMQMQMWMWMLEVESGTVRM